MLDSLGKERRSSNQCIKRDYGYITDYDASRKKNAGDVKIIEIVCKRFAGK